MTKHRQIILACSLIILVLSLSCTREYQKEEHPIVKEAQLFIDQYANTYANLQQAHLTALNKWKLGKGDSALLTQATADLYSFLGKQEHLNKASQLIDQKGVLMPLQYVQLSQLLYQATEYPQVDEGAKEVKWQQALEKERQVIIAKRYHWNDLEALYRQSSTDKSRAQLWELAFKGMVSSYDTLEQLVAFRNEYVVASGYANYYDYKADAYQMSRQEATELRQAFLMSVRPLFEELYQWVRYELAQRYNRGLIPTYLPAHWLADMHGYQWNLDFQREHRRLEDSLSSISSTAMQQQVERFFTGLQWTSVPVDNYRYVKLQKPQRLHSWTVSSLLDGPIVYLDLDSSLQSYQDFTKAYTIASITSTYTNPDVPLLLRKPAVPAMEQAWSNVLRAQSLRWLQQQYMPTDSLRKIQVRRRLLLEEALETIPRLVFYAGVVGGFERALYAGSMPKTDYNRRWWALVKRYMGISLPTSDLDAYGGVLRYKPIANQPLSSLDSLLGIGMQYQIANQGFTSDSTSKHASMLMNRMMYGGASLTWRKVYEQQNIATPNGEAIATYFEPLYQWLKKQNEGRKNTLPSWEIDVNEQRLIQ